MSSDNTVTENTAAAEVEENPHKLVIKIVLGLAALAGLASLGIKIAEGVLS